MRIEDIGGRPSLQDIESVKKRIFELIEGMKIVHPERIRREYNAKYREEGQKIAWITIRKYLDQLIKEEKIKEQVITEGRRRTISLIKINY